MKRNSIRTPKVNKAGSNIPGTNIRIEQYTKEEMDELWNKLNSSNLLF